MIRLELGYGLLSLAGGDSAAPDRPDQGRCAARIASEMGFVMPPVRIQDNMQLGADTYSVRIKEIEAGRGELRPTMLLVMDPRGADSTCPASTPPNPPSACRRCGSSRPCARRRLFRGYTVVDPPTVLTTHLTEVVKEKMAELLSYAETQKLLDELPREHQKLVGELIPTQISVGGVQRVLQELLAERVSIRDLPTILEGIPEACAGHHAQRHRDHRACAHAAGAADQRRQHRRRRATSPWSRSRRSGSRRSLEALAGPREERQLAMAPSKLQEFMQRFRSVFDAAAHGGETPVLLTSSPIRFHVRAIVERIRPATPVLAQTEIYPRARIRTLGSI